MKNLFLVLTVLGSVSFASAQTVQKEPSNFISTKNLGYTIISSPVGAEPFAVDSIFAKWVETNRDENSDKELQYKGNKVNIESRKKIKTVTNEN
jgi:hypothetical protein